MAERESFKNKSMISYQITMATIFKTASFKLWQKLTRALPLGPILPNIIPVRRTEQYQIHTYNNVRTKVNVVNVYYSF